MQRRVSSQPSAVAAPLSDDDEISEDIDEDIENINDDEEEEDIVKPMIIK